MSSDLIFIIGRQRSGTTVFRDLLERYGVRNCDEIFHGDLKHQDRFYRYVLKRMEKEPHLVHPEHHPMLFRHYVEELRQKSPGMKLAMDVKYFGLNLIPVKGDVDGRSPFVVNYMRNTGAHVVHIVRNNKLRIFVSERIAQVTGRWSAGRVEHLVSQKPRITVDVAEVLHYINSLIRQDKRVIAMLDRIPNSRRLIYSEMFDVDGMFTAPVIDAAKSILELDHVDPKPGNLKMNPEPISALVENFSDLQAALEATEHGWMLDDNG